MTHPSRLDELMRQAEGAANDDEDGADYWQDWLSDHEPVFSAPPAPNDDLSPRTRWTLAVLFGVVVTAIIVWLGAWVLS